MRKGTGGMEGGFWPCYAPNPLRGGATKGADADFAPRLRDLAGNVEGQSLWEERIWMSNWKLRKIRPQNSQPKKHLL